MIYEGQYYQYRCPKCEVINDIESCDMPYGDREELPIQCYHCGYEVKIECRASYEHFVFADIDGKEYDVTDYYSDEFEIAQNLIKEKVKE